MIRERKQDRVPALTQRPNGRDALRHRKRRTAAALAVIAVGMVGMSFAAVPLYRLFCAVTGYGGTTQVAEAAAVPSEERVTVRFDANVAGDMPWVFEAPEPVELALGESKVVSYKGRNPTDRPILGTASYNVVPFKAGPYFNKVECFCFTEQLLMPGEEKEFAVTFFVDPEIAEDPNMADVNTITLSYTFFDKGPAALEQYIASHGIKAAELKGDAYGQP